MRVAHPQAARTACRFAHPLAGGNTGGPAEPAPRCYWHIPRLRALRADSAVFGERGARCGMELEFAV